jgi:hypothetical protein
MISKETAMSSYSYSTLDPALRQLLGPSTTEQLRLSRQAAHRYSLAEAAAERRAASASRRPTERSLWERARRLVVRPHPA